jgi:hypothetical protein
MRYVPPKRRLTFNGLNGVVSQKIGFLVFNLVDLNTYLKIAFLSHANHQLMVFMEVVIAVSYT